jgi:hypothetical protein
MDGWGNSTSPCQIKNWIDLNASRYDVTIYYDLVNNLSNTDGDYISNFLPLGGSTNANYYVTGVYNGRNNSITGLKITSTASHSGLLAVLTGTLKDLHAGIFFNPWIQYYNRGIGTLANKDVWGLFDQILLSQSFFDSTSNNWKFLKAEIYHHPFMTENTGRYKGYPMRTWDGNNYRGGFSDHFPTYVILQRH